MVEWRIGLVAAIGKIANHGAVLGILPGGIDFVLLVFDEGVRGLAHFDTYGMLAVGIFAKLYGHATCANEHRNQDQKIQSWFHHCCWPFGYSPFRYSE